MGKEDLEGPQAVNLIFEFTFLPRAVGRNYSVFHIVMPRENHLY
jgi:hypothetical protein